MNSAMTSQYMMIKPLKSFCLTLLCLGLIFIVSVKAQDAASQNGLLWKAARSAFDSGDYATSAKNFSAIIANAAPLALKFADDSKAVTMPVLPKWVEPAFYMTGASYFNMKDWPNSIVTFNRYLRLFPHLPNSDEVRFSLAQTQLLGGHPADAIVNLKMLMTIPVFHVRCVALLAEAYVKTGNISGAIDVYEKERQLPNLRLEYVEKLNTKLIGYYLDQKDIAKAVALLQEIDDDIEHVPDVTAFNSLAARLGDALLAKGQVSDALNCYRRVRNNEQVIALEKVQIATLKRRLADNLTFIQANPMNSADLILANKDITAQIDRGQKILAQYLTLPPILPPLLVRIGSAYTTDNQLWEAAVVYRELMRRYPTRPEVEPALYGSIAVFQRTKQTARAQALCLDYLTKYPQGKYANAVGYLRGVLAYEAEDFDKAITYFNDSLKNQPKSPQREQIELIVGDIHLRQQKFDDAIKAYQKYLADYPSGNHVEQATYRINLALIFGGMAEEADTGIRAYMKKYPLGVYVPDAAYRLAVIKFASKRYDEVLADGLDWQKKYGTAGPLAEVLSLMGDCYASTGQENEAIKAYTRSYKAAQTPEVLSYSLFGAAKLLQKQTRWAEVAKMFQEFLKANPEHPLLVQCVVWIGRADVKLGKVDEAKKDMADTAKQYLNDPTKEGVDEILTQLAQLYGKRHIVAMPPPVTTVPAMPGAVAATGTATPITAPTPAPIDTTPVVDPEQALVDALTIPDLDKKPTASARILFAKSELARIQKKPDIEGQILLDIAAKYKPEDLSAVILGMVGDCLIQAGKPDEAALFYGQLLDEYATSHVVDFAYNGLARIAYDKKDYKKALKLYSKPLDDGSAGAKLKEITLGQAQTLLALNRLDDAKTVFESVASNRAWRGEATALSVYSLGEIQMQQAKYPEANAYYQRVYVAYQKYPAIQAKAYLRSGEVFEKLGKVVEARNTYTEMLKNPNLSSYPEAAEAKQHLNPLIQK